MGGASLARTALISDMHGNMEALTVVLRTIDSLGVDAIVSVGDSVDYGPRPKEVLAALQERQVLGVKGNHDAAVTGEIGWERFAHIHEPALRWTQQTLADADKAYLMALPEVLDLGWGYLVHGSTFEHLWHYVADATQAMMVFRRSKEVLHIVGHTHVGTAYQYSEQRQVKIVPGRPRQRGITEMGSRCLEFAEHSRYIINPGSVGQPRDADPRAAFAVVEHDTSQAYSVTWYRVPYDWDLVRSQILDAGLPELFGDRLLQGR